MNQGIRRPSDAVLIRVPILRCESNNPAQVCMPLLARRCRSPGMLNGLIIGRETENLFRGPLTTIHATTIFYSVSFTIAIAAFADEYNGTDADASWTGREKQELLRRAASRSEISL